MKILHVGASGVIGRAVMTLLSKRHDMITAGRTTGDLRIDITDPQSIREGFQKLGSVDAVIATAGKVKFAPFTEMKAEDYKIGLNNKLMGQINLVLIGQKSVSDFGSFTLTTGVLDRDPIRQGTSASMVNGAINSFVVAAAIEMERGLRINSVSPGVIEEAMGSYEPYFRGFEPVAAARAALAYEKSVDGSQTGQVYRVG